MTANISIPLNITVSLQPGDTLSLLVENLGRVDYYSRGNAYADRFRQSQKGIVGKVSVDDTTLQDWDIYPIPLIDLPSGKSRDIEFPQEIPLFYHGTFSIPPSSLAPAEEDAAALDAFLALPAGVKGQVFINGFHLGRFWRVGPQQSLYVPGTLLHRWGANEVVVLELEPDRVVNGTMVVEGVAKREWFVLPDLDCVACV